MAENVAEFDFVDSTSTDTLVSQNQSKNKIRKDRLLRALLWSLVTFIVLSSFVLNVAGFLLIRECKSAISELVVFNHGKTSKSYSQKFMAEDPNGPIHVPIPPRKNTSDSIKNQEIPFSYQTSEPKRSTKTEALLQSMVESLEENARSIQQLHTFTAKQMTKIDDSFTDVMEKINRLFQSIVSSSSSKDGSVLALHNMTSSLTDTLNLTLEKFTADSEHFKTTSEKQQTELLTKLEGLGDKMQTQLSSMASSLDLGLSNIYKRLSNGVVSQEQHLTLVESTSRLEKAINDSHRMESVKLELFANNIGRIGSTLNDTVNRALPNIDSSLNDISNRLINDVVSQRQFSDLQKSMSRIGSAINDSILNGTVRFDKIFGDISQMENALNQSTSYLRNDLPQTISDMLNTSTSSLAAPLGQVFQETVHGLVLSQSAELNKLSDSLQNSQQESLLNLTNTMQTISVAPTNLNSVITRMSSKFDSQVGTLSKMISSLSQVRTQLKDLPNKIQAMQLETVKDSKVQFCTAGKGCRLVWNTQDQKKFRCFKFSTDSQTWAGAKNECQKMGGYLAEILDHDTLNYVSQLSGGRDVWLGASDIAKEGDWRWEKSGLKVTLAHWVRNQPDNHGNNEDCLHMWRSFNMKWNDAPCSSRLKYLCEKFDENCEGWD